MTCVSVNSILIANRGEIACRISRTARRLGVRTVAVYSEVDANSLHVTTADSAICVGPAALNESYLNIAALIEAATLTGCDSVHPGYGFLSENPVFVEACEHAGLTFIGPGAEAIRAMGLKDSAKTLMSQVGVPVVPGYHGGVQDVQKLTEQAESIGYPLLIKARAGGGGKGMRRVNTASDFVNALTSARREAESSFGDPDVLLEKYIEHPRHIEIQIFGDTHGNVVHMYERDCSLQRRHQKVIEEAPAPGMTHVMRSAMTDAAIKAAQAIDYVGAGTVEFIVDSRESLRPDGFWFMEMNTRLQVEHPVTEAITGLDLVEWQIRVARGEPLPLDQSQIKLQGHSVEARLYAEDVAAGFLPATGVLHRWRMSTAGRVDSGVQQADVVSPHYDPLLAKLIAHGDTRGQAFTKLAQMLSTSAVIGTKTNREFLSALCLHPDVLCGDLSTDLIGENFESLITTSISPLTSAIAAIVMTAVPSTSSLAATVPAYQLGNWQLWGRPTRQIELRFGSEEIVFKVQRTSVDEWSVSSAGSAVVCCIADLSALFHGTYVVSANQRYSVEVVRVDNGLHVQLDCQLAAFSPVVGEGKSAIDISNKSLQAPMPGRITGVYCVAGEEVEEGALLVTLEAMKMEHSVFAPRAGIVELIQVEVEEQVEQGHTLLRFLSE